MRNECLCITSKAGLSANRNINVKDKCNIYNFDFLGRNFSNYLMVKAKNAHNHKLQPASVFEASLSILLSINYFNSFFHQFVPSFLYSLNGRSELNVRNNADSLCFSSVRIINSNTTNHCTYSAWKVDP